MTQQQQITAPNPTIMSTELEGAVAAADSNLAAKNEVQRKLSEHVEERRVEENKHRITFQREPTQAAHGLLAVAEQRRKNAEADLEKHESGELEQAKIDAIKAKNALLRDRFAREYPEDAIDGLVQQFVDIGTDAVRGFGQGSAALEKLLVERKEKQPEASAVGHYLPQYRFSELVAKANAAISKLLPSGASDRFARLVVHEQGNQLLMVFEVHLPMQINSRVK